MAFTKTEDASPASYFLEIINDMSESGEQVRDDGWDFWAGDTSGCARIEGKGLQVY